VLDSAAVVIVSFVGNQTNVRFTKRRTKIQSTTKYAVALDPKAVALLLKSGETKPGDQFTGGVCDACISTKPRSK
jgi:hypothetical protein